MTKTIRKTQVRERSIILSRAQIGRDNFFSAFYRRNIHWVSNLDRHIDRVWLTRDRHVGQVLFRVVLYYKKHKRLNTGMAPTCDWMIKIVKVNKLYFNSLLVSIVYRVSQSGTMKYQCEWKHRCIKQEMVTNVAKRRQPFLFSEVVQRGRSAILRRWKSYLLTKLIWSVQADDQRLEPFLYFTADRNSSDSNVY